MTEGFGQNAYREKGDCMPTSIDWFKEFEFNLPTALLRDLVALLDDMSRAPLDAATVASIPEEQGVYQLFLDDMLVYVGKTDSDAGLNLRLGRHANKIRHRHGLDPKRVSFKAVRIFVFTPVDLEQQLIKHYSAATRVALAWNNSGFGANDPGRERDTTKLKGGHFDRRYPINIDVELCSSAVAGEFSVADVLSTLKLEVPYVIRFQNLGGRSRKPHPDLVSTKIKIPSGAHTARSVLRLVKEALGAAWQITVQPGYVIVYKESKMYPHAGTL